MTLFHGAGGGLLRAPLGGLAGSTECCCDCEGGSVPTFTSSPSLTATECVQYSYNPTVTTDPAGQTVVWSFDSPPTPPTGATISPTTGQVLWTPGGDAAPGPHSIKIKATDECGRVQSQQWSVDVTDDPCCDNAAPTITSSPGTAATEGVEYSHQLTIDDDEQSDVTYCLTVSPDGMSVDGDGLITWTPGCDQAGTHNVTACVGDACYDCELEEGDCVSWQIEVTDDPECV